MNRFEIVTHQLAEVQADSFRGQLALKKVTGKIQDFKVEVSVVNDHEEISIKVLTNKGLDFIDAKVVINYAVDHD